MKAILINYYRLFLSLPLSLSLKVISRIFYTVDRTWKGRITLCDMQNSNFLQTLTRLETENDINKISDYFSYEHFYVIYCKFWELDSDHDLLISAEDLVRHNDHGMWPIYCTCTCIWAIMGLPYYVHSSPACIIVCVVFSTCTCMFVSLLCVIFHT